MKRFNELLPATLLISYLILCGFRQPNLAEAFIILGLSGLTLFRSVMEYRPRKDISEQLAEQKLQIYQEMSELKADLTDKISKNSLGAVPINNTQTSVSPVVKKKIIF